MLTLEDRHVSRGPSALRRAYWCEAVAYGERSWWIGHYPTSSPRLALRWMRVRVATVADQVEPAAALPPRVWLADTIEHERAMSQLACGEMYCVVITDDDVWYVVSARPTGHLPSLPGIRGGGRG